jgi:leader peptidase (prepilin peptidase) / N-methyltransferase
MLVAALAALLFGLIIGSFLNVVIHRLPRKESLSSPPSHCPGCGTPVKPYDNVPVVSWLLLRGRCRHCDAPISRRYPLVELLTGLLYLAVVLAKYDEALDVALGIALVTLLVPMTFIDLDTRTIPNRLLVPFAVLAPVLALVLDPDFLPEQAIAGAAAFLFFLLAALAYPKGMGMGDVKLVGVLGLYLGRAVAPAIFAGLIAGVLVGMIIIARLGSEAGRKVKVPFGPFLALGAVLALFVGEDLVDGYVDTF